MLALTAAFVVGAKLENVHAFYWKLQNRWHSRGQTKAPQFIPTVSPQEHIIKDYAPSLARLSADDFASRTKEVRDKIRAHFKLDRMATSPSRVVYEDNLAGGITLKLIAYESFDGTEIPAFHIYPTDKPTPDKIVLAITGNGAGIIELAGYQNSYQHSYALQLAKAGYYVVAPEMRGQGYLSTPNVPNTAVLALSMDSSFTEWVLRDIAYALDSVNPAPKALAVTGVSMGGLFAILYGALDERVGTVISMGFDNFGTRQDDFAFQTGLAETEQGLCTNPQHIKPGLHRMIRFGKDNRGLGEIPLLIAPRPWLIVYGEKDPFTPNQHDFELSPYWPKDQLTMQIEKGQHEYFIEPALAWLKKYL